MAAKVNHCGKAMGRIVVMRLSPYLLLGALFGFWLFMGDLAPIELERRLPFLPFWMVILIQFLWLALIVIYPILMLLMSQALRLVPAPLGAHHFLIGLGAWVVLVAVKLSV